MIGSIANNVKVVADTLKSEMHNVIVYCADGKPIAKAQGWMQLINPGDAHWTESWNLWFLGILLCLILFCSFFRKWKTLVNWLSHHIFGASILVFIAGFLVYTWGFYNSALSWYSVIPRSIVSSFKMFVVMHDLARVNSDLFTNNLYMAWFSLTHFAAALLTFLFIFKLVGFRLFSALRLWGLGVKLWFAKYLRIFRQNNVHIFWGINEESLLLAESIAENKNEVGSLVKHDKIIFVSIVEDNEDMPRQKATLGSITDIITLKNSDLERLDKINALVDNCHNGPASVFATKKGKEEESEINAFKTLRLRLIKRIVKRAASVNFYLFSENENQNVVGALNLQIDKTITSRKDVKIYVHARKTINGELFDTYAQYVNQNDEVSSTDKSCDESNKTTTYPPSVKLVDSAYKSVKTLIKDCNLPVDCVDFDSKTGLVSTPFTSLIIGFNATGQEAFKYLYEHGTFIGHDKKKLPFKCYAVDQNMTAIKGIITSKVGYVIENKELELINTEVNSKKFWNKVECLINELNYVVIALNDDELGLQLAVNIFKLALRKRNNNLQLKIALRCYNESNIRMMHKAEKNLNESIKDSVINVSLKVFGDQQSIFNYETVISDVMLVKATRYNWVYEQTTPTYGEEKKAMTEDEQWESSFGMKAVNDLLPQDASHRSLYHAKYEMLCRIEQNFANVAHAKTKLRLMGIVNKVNNDNEVIDHGKLEELLSVIDKREKGTTDYKCDNPEYTELLHNMALLEHERFISARHLKGFIQDPNNNKTPQKDFVKKYHNCLCAFSELKESTQSYDNNVIDTTLKLKQEEIRENNSKKGDRKA